MAKAKVKLDFLQLPIPEKIEFVRDRVVDMTGNVNFPTPSPSLNTITTQVDDLETKQLAAQGGGPAQTAARDAAELVLDDSMRDLADYVNGIADGDVVIITSAGFTPTTTVDTPANPPSKPENLKLTHGQQSGTIIANCDALQGTKAWATVITTSQTPPVTVADESVVIQTGGGAGPGPGPGPIPVPVGNLFFVLKFTTLRKTTHTGLTSGTRYYVWKFAINSAGRSPDSDVISIVAP